MKKEKGNLCYYCDHVIKNEELIFLHVAHRGYGSLFDSCRFTVQLCNTCHQPEYKQWFEEKPKLINRMEHYQFEEKIQLLVNQFKIKNREYVWNGMSGYYMQRQDWIDMEKEVLPEHKYQDHGMYSPRQINAYKEQFPICDYPVNVSFSDGSKNSMCVHGAIGDYGQLPNKTISPNCDLCPVFVFRKTPLEEIAYEDFLTYQDLMTINQTNAHEDDSNKK